MTQNHAVLAKPAIIDAVKNGQIVISNFDERQVNNSSYDIRLGRWFYELKPDGGAIDPYDQESVLFAWGKPIKADHIILRPGAFVLGHSEEFIGGVDNTHTTMIKARSTTGRSGVQIASCAGWGDIGFATRWTLELRNNTSRDVLLRAGQRIGQVVFIPTTGVQDSDLYDRKGKYQAETLGTLTGLSHQQLDEQWDPESMLPKAWLDWDVQEVKNASL